MTFILCIFYFQIIQEFLNLQKSVQVVLIACRDYVLTRIINLRDARHHIREHYVLANVSELEYVSLSRETVTMPLIRGGFKKFEEKCCQICNCHEKFTFSVHVVN